MNSQFESMNSDFETSQAENDIPQEALEAVTKVTHDVFMEVRYDKAYEAFKNWWPEKKNVDEEVLLVYFTEEYEKLLRLYGSYVQWSNSCWS